MPIVSIWTRPRTTRPTSEGRGVVQGPAERCGRRNPLNVAGRSTWALLAVGAGALLVAGCGGGGGKATTTEPDVSGHATAVIVDGYGREPVAGATVLAYDGAGRPLSSGALSDATGRVALPEGTTGVCASTAKLPIACRGLLPGRLRVTVPLYDPAVESPEYGGGPNRTRNVSAVRVPPPSGAPAWTYRGKALLEFPPVVARGTVVLATNRGRVIAFDAATGAIRWQRRQTTSSYIAASPAILPADDRVVVASMDGRLVAYDLSSGRTAWEFSAGTSEIESSPLVIGETVIIGAWNGRLYAVSTNTGRIRWTFQADGQIKGSAAQAGGNVIFGDYAGHVYAVRAGDGSLVWKTAAGKRFYGGPAVSGTTAVIGDVGGAVVALNTVTGRRLWRHSTGGTYVYGSPAVAAGAAYIGSYNGMFEALDLRTGRVRWSFDAGGRISGSATVVGDTVYTAVLARHGEHDRTFGLDTATGRVTWRGDDGRYSPAVAAGRTLYIVGRTTLYAYPAP